MLCDLRPTLADFASLPRILNNLVKDIADRMEEIGLKEKQADAPIQNHLAFLLECDVAAYHLQLARWICQYESDIQIISSWLAICSLTVDEYVALLEQQKESDGLEAWAASIALGQPINVIFDDVVWSTSAAGFDHSYLLLLFTSHATAILCEEDPPEDDLSQMGEAAPLVLGVQGSKW